MGDGDDPTPATTDVIQRYHSMGGDLAIKIITLPIYTQIMSYRLLVPSTTVIGLASYSLGTKRPLLFTPIRCETATSSWPNFSSWRLRSEPKPEPYVATRIHTTPKTTFSPMLYRQISTGSFLGLAAGFAVGKFSKSIGLAVGSLLLLIEVGLPNAVKVEVEVES